MNYIIYKDNYLKFPLSDEEYNNIDKVWNFIEEITVPYISFSDYRNYIIKTIRKKYDIEQFYFLENIANKLLWNLRWKLFPVLQNNNITIDEYNEFVKNNYENMNDIPNELLQIDKIYYIDNADLQKKINQNKLMEINYYRSFINKLLIVDNDKKIIHIKEMEGSSDIFSKNYFNLLSFTIFIKRKLYEKVMRNPFIIVKNRLKIPKYYHQMDYGFPNLNLCTYSFGDKKCKLNRIKKMYYYENNNKNNKNKKDNYWFKLIL